MDWEEIQTLVNAIREVRKTQDLLARQEAMETARRILEEAMKNSIAQHGLSQEGRVLRPMDDSPLELPRNRRAARLVRNALGQLGIKSNQHTKTLESLSSRELRKAAGTLEALRALIDWARERNLKLAQIEPMDDLSDKAGRVLESLGIADNSDIQTALRKISSGQLRAAAKGTIYDEISKWAQRHELKLPN